MKLQNKLHHRLIALLLLSFSAIAIAPAQALDSQTLTSELDALILESNNLVVS